ncbi:MAG: hypothetical protein M3X11_24755 [Acidobacteriota bacterium]|nr:hypothetical protein [Acidobacteriota bacterium]
MTLLSKSFLVLIAVGLIVVEMLAVEMVAMGQTPAPRTSAPALSPTGPLLKSNPKISQPDFDAAKTETLAAGGDKAELVYAARIDSVQRSSYDSLIVVYQKPARVGKDSFAFVLREGQRLPLVFDKQDKQGRALKSGDKFLRIGLKHEEGKSPLLRLIASSIDKEKGEQQRNMDFQFDGAAFSLIGQSMTPLPK